MGYMDISTWSLYCKTKLKQTNESNSSKKPGTVDNHHSCMDYFPLLLWPFFAPQCRSLMNSAAPATEFIIFYMTLLLLMVNLNVCVSEDHKDEIFTQDRDEGETGRTDRLWVSLGVVGLSLLIQLSNVKGHLYTSGRAHRWGEPPPL